MAAIGAEFAHKLTHPEAATVAGAAAIVELPTLMVSVVLSADIRLLSIAHCASRNAASLLTTVALLESARVMSIPKRWRVLG
jgi:hypothetical protein